MRVGIACSGVGPGSTGTFIAAAARAAERSGFSTLWSGEHVVLFDAYPASSYPYKGDFGGDVPLPDPTIAMVDPIVAMSWAAASTTTLELGSGVVILPQRNPVVLAKQLATLDVLSSGRVVFGAGVGWCKEEYDAVGADWPGRGKRTDEYLAALRALWRDSPATFRSETLDLRGAYLYPKPVRNSDIPIVIGGESDAALRRTARLGDGWLAFKLTVDEAPSRIKMLRGLVAEEGRDPNGMRIIVTIFTHTSYDDMRRYRDAGVTEFSLMAVGELPLDVPGMTAKIDQLAQRFVGKAASM